MLAVTALAHTLPVMIHDGERNGAHGAPSGAIGAWILHIGDICTIWASREKKHHLPRTGLFDVLYFKGALASLTPLLYRLATDFHTAVAHNVLRNL